MTLNKGFPIDAQAVKRYGLDKWREEFSSPVSEEEFISLYWDIEALFASLMGRYDGLTRELFVIHHKFKIEYANIINAIWVAQRAQKTGKSILYSDDSWWYKNIAEDKDIDIRIQIARFVPYSWQHRALSFIKGHMLSLYHCGIIKYLNRHKGDFVVKLFYGTVTDLMSHYIKKLPQGIDFTYRCDWFSNGPSHKLSGELASRIDEVSQLVMEGLIDIAKKRSIRLNQRHIDQIRLFTKNEFVNAAELYLTVEDRVKRERKKIHLILANSVNPVERIVSIVVRKYGGKVTAFAHGGDNGFRNISISKDVTTADEFIAYTASSVDLYNRITYKSTSWERDYPFNVNSVESDEFFKLWQGMQRFRSSGKIKKVMIVGYPHNQWRRILYVGGSSLVRLDLELRLIDLLKKNGYEPIYKAHPETLKGIKGIFDNKVKVLTNDFKESVEEADLFIFPTITSTAFFQGICSSKPAIALDLSFKVSDPFPEVMGQLKKRCRIITTRMDERNRIVFNEEELLKAIESPSSDIDIEFLREYMFPERIKHTLR